MVKRYLGAVLVAFVLGGVGPLTVAAAQAAEEPDEAPSPLGSVTETLGGLTSSDAHAGSDVDAPGAEPDEPGPGDAAPTAPGPDHPEPGGPEPAAPGAGTAPAPDADGDDSPGGAGLLGAVTTTASRLADAPRSLLTDVADGETPTPDVPARPDVPEPDAPAPPADTPTRPNEPETPNAPDGPKKPETPERPPNDVPAGPPANAESPAGPPTNVALALPDVDQSGVTDPEQNGPAPAQQSIIQPDTAEPGRVASQRPRQDVPAFPDPTDSSGDNPADQEEPAGRPPQDVRAETISLRHVTQTPFVLAIALLTAVGVVTVRRVITVK